MNPFTDYLHKSIILDYYKDNRITIREVAALNNVSEQTVKFHLRKEGRGKKDRVNTGKAPMSIQAEVVEYFMQHMNETQREISDRFGVSIYTVSKWTTKYLQFLTT